MTYRIGIIGGTGALGSAIAHGLITSATIAPGNILLGGRRGQGGLPGYPQVGYTYDLAALAADCDVILLSLPPQQAHGLRVPVGDKLVMSVMAGITIDTIARITGTPRIIRAMSSPAAAQRQAYSPWFPAPGCLDADHAIARQIFSAIGATDRLTIEAHLDVFTAITGPMPGFVALFAETMADYARAQGIAPELAERAVRQLFSAAGPVLASPGQQVQAMIDYAGTTAAGMVAMREAGLGQVVAAGLDAAVAKAREMGDDGQADPRPGL
ncbi:pyrroline-5-carboxylate reductase family protein [Actibacterium sp. XHP0104]|uniref:pyrroline-5-carboxylate reductase family protein n=1 Tax=Actibacterium sp. XHP0104 TaxID=2984335 RepID=UPI0021E75BDC|nr:pyrroline-5-carboxylate reductase dimerization domain-containing protein [Actibacterium sp. XHP0104]MCV2882433.1 NAD(P)-binding domain-containing protein [Actibacterium sp. XHP0104]